MSFQQSRAFEDLDEVLADVDKFLFMVRVVGAHGIGLVVPVGDDPAFVGVGFQVFFDPLHLRAEGIIDPVAVVFDAV
jgi:hypothetical protein